MRKRPAAVVLSAFCACLLWHPSAAWAGAATDQLVQAQQTLQTRTEEVRRAEAQLAQAQADLSRTQAAQAAAQEAWAWSRQADSAASPTLAAQSNALLETADCSEGCPLAAATSPWEQGDEAPLSAAEAQEAQSQARAALQAAEKHLRDTEAAVAQARDAQNTAQAACDAAKADAAAEQEAQRAANQQRAAAEANPELPPVDWSLSRDEFVAAWAPRIDAWLGSSPLGGHGATFAEAAWDNGVDPRWSPAIANVESSKGAVCFRPHNAWGWGSTSWPDWDTAIRAHVAGLSSGYGHTVSQGAARKYCPPNAGHWYSATLACMAQI